MYDRIIRSDLFTSNRFVDLHEDTHRLLFVYLLLRSDDFGCQDRDLRAILREVFHCTQLRTHEAVASALQALAEQDLIRLYEVPNPTPGGDPLPGIFIPRFRSSRTYSKRRFAPSPWCAASRGEQEQYGQTRQAYGRDAFRVQKDGEPVVNKPQRDKDKRSTKASSDTDLTQPGVRPATDLSQDHGALSQAPVVSPVISNDQYLALESATGERQTIDRSVADLSQGEGRGGEERGSVRAKRITSSWTIPDEWVEWAQGFALDQGHHVTRTAVLRVADSFRDYYTAKAGKDATKLDWLATWRNWFRREDLAKLARIVVDDGEPDFMRRAR